MRLCDRNGPNRCFSRTPHSLLSCVLLERASPWCRAGEKEKQRCSPALTPGGCQIVIFRNRNAPMTVMAILNPPITAKQATGSICDAPVSPYRIPSTP